MRHTGIFKAVTATLGALALAIGLAACGTSHKPVPAKTPTPVASTVAPTPSATTAAPSPSPATPTACQLTATWYASGGKAQLATFTADAKALATGAATGNQVALSSEAQTVAVDTSNDTASPPPTGAAGAGNWLAAVSDYHTAALTISAGLLNRNASAIATATAEVNAGNAQFALAETAITACG